MTKLLQKSKALTQNDKVVKEQCYMSRSSEGQGHNAERKKGKTTT